MFRKLNSGVSGAPSAGSVPPVMSTRERLDGSAAWRPAGSQPAAGDAGVHAFVYTKLARRPRIPDPCLVQASQGDIMTVKRMHNVGIVVENLDVAVEFFGELGLELEGRATIEGEWAG